MPWRWGHIDIAIGWKLFFVHPYIVNCSSQIRFGDLCAFYLDNKS